MRFIVTGPNGYSDRDAVKELIDRLAAKYDSPIVMTRARKGGLDKVIEYFAWKVWLTTEGYYPESAANPKLALQGQITTMAKKADKAFIFFDGKDAETADAIRILSNMGIKGKIIKY